jgi:hypothetical protein
LAAALRVHFRADTKRPPRKLSLGKETLKLVTGSGPTLPGPRWHVRFSAQGRTLYTCYNGNACNPLGCQTDYRSILFC